MMNPKTQGLANVLASTTDQDRAKVLAQESEPSEEGAKAPKPKKEAVSDVKTKMAENEKAGNLSTAFNKIHDAIRAAQDSAKEKLEADPKADETQLFQDAGRELLDIITELVEDKDVFKQLAKEANKLRIG